MKTDYPELADIPEFMELNNKEMLLVWYFSNETSPFANVRSSRDRMSASIDKAYGRSVSQDLKNALLTGQYEEKFRSAFERMAKFSANTRSRANKAVTSIFDNFCMIVSLTPEEVKEMNEEEQAAYVNTASKVASGMPDLVRQVENGYGIKDRSGEDGYGGNIMDGIIENS